VQELVGTKSSKPIERTLRQKEGRKEEKYARVVGRSGAAIWGLALSSGGWTGPGLTNFVHLIASTANMNYDVPEGLYRAALNQRLSVAFHKAKAAAFRAALGTFTKRKRNGQADLPRRHILNATSSETPSQLGGRVRGFDNGDGWGAG